MSEARSAERNGVRVIMGENSTETGYLGLEIAMCDALGVDILQARNVRVGRAHSVEGVLKARNTFER